MSVQILAIDHVGIRISDRADALAFYRVLGFVEVAHHPKARVTIVRNDAGVELNLIDNATSQLAANVLLDLPDRHAGITHVALRVHSLAEVEARLREANITPSGGPELLGDGVSLFVRDPDWNVIELRESPASRGAVGSS